MIEADQAFLGGGWLAGKRARVRETGVRNKNLFLRYWPKIHEIREHLRNFASFCPQRFYSVFPTFSAVHRHVSCSTY